MSAGPSQTDLDVMADKKIRTPIINPSTRTHHIHQYEDSNDDAPVSPSHCVQNDVGYIYIDVDINGHPSTSSLKFITSPHLHKNGSIPTTISEEADLPK